MSQTIQFVVDVEIEDDDIDVSEIDIANIDLDFGSRNQNDEPEYSWAVRKVGE